jgi:mannose-6-phosphate isomerase
MGTHPKVPSKTLEGVSLRDVIASNPQELLGEEIIKKYAATNELPFLFKVLSIEKVLSIQAHPDKQLAKKLHINDPKNYPDDNHKPEMAIAVTEFEGFCGFKPLEEIADELQKIPEFKVIVGDDVTEKFVKGIRSNVEIGTPDDKSNRELLQLVFGKVMNASDEAIATQADSLVSRAQSQPELFAKDLPELILRLNKQFPQDVGLFCGCLMLNHCKLTAGEAMFLQAKDPHAYINGDIIECMAASDNVVRAGFTPKFKDVENLVEMLTYSYESVEKQKMIAEKFPRSRGAGDSLLFNPPIEEFAVLQTTFKSSTGKRKFQGFGGPSILIITNGEGYIHYDGQKIKAEPGFNFFIAPKVEVELETQDEEFTSYRAFVEV